MPCHALSLHGDYTKVDPPQSSENRINIEDFACYTANSAKRRLPGVDHARKVLTNIKGSLILQRIKGSLMSKPKIYTARHIKVRLTPDHDARLTRLSKKSGRPVAVIIRACITRALDFIENHVEQQLAKGGEL